MTIVGDDYVTSKSRNAFSFRINGRTSSRMAIFSLLAARRVNVGNGEHDVGVFRREGGDFVVRNGRTAGEPFVYGEDHTSVLRER